MQIVRGKGAGITHRLLRNGRTACGRRVTGPDGEGLPTCVQCLHSVEFEPLELSGATIPDQPMHNPPRVLTFRPYLSPVSIPVVAAPLKHAEGFHMKAYSEQWTQKKRQRWGGWRPRPGGRR